MKNELEHAKSKNHIRRNLLDSPFIAKMFSSTKTYPAYVIFLIIIQNLKSQFRDPKSNKHLHLPNTHEYALEKTQIIHHDK